MEQAKQNCVRDLKRQLLISVATTEMLCHLDISLSSAFSVVMVPFTESMLNNLSRSVCRSMEYLKEQHKIIQFYANMCNFITTVNTAHCVLSVTVWDVCIHVMLLVQSNPVLIPSARKDFCLHTAKYVKKSVPHSNSLVSKANIQFSVLSKHCSSPLLPAHLS